MNSTSITFQQLLLLVILRPVECGEEAAMLGQSAKDARKQEEE